MLNICRKEHERASINGQKKKEIGRERVNAMLKQMRKRYRKNVREWEKERCCVCVCGNPVKMWQIERTWGRALGAESNGEYNNVQTLESYARYIYPSPKNVPPYLSTYLLVLSYPTFPFYQPPAAPSHSSYEPRAGRSEYNFLYCVNVRTYVWIRKMFILRNARRWIIASLNPRVKNVHPTWD